MVVKSLNLLKKNSVIILFYAAYMVVMYLIVFMLYPKDMTQFMNVDPNNFDFAAYFIMMTKLFIALILMGVLGILFLSGFGSMISEAVVKGKTSANSFLPGLKKYFVRVLLSSLLLVAFSIGLTIVLSIIAIPLTFLAILSGNMMNSIIIGIFTSMIVIFSVPFVTLWFPSIFIDDVGVIQGLKNGAKAGFKNYWKLLLMILLMYLPVIVNTAINYSSIANGVIFTPGYIVTCIIVSIITIIAIPAIFLIYEEYQQKRRIITLNKE